MASSIVTIRDEQQVNTTTTGDQESPNVTALADGGWVVTWVSIGQDGASGGIYQQRYHADGSLYGIERQVNTVTADSQHSPTVAVLSDGGWVVTWVSNAQDGSAGGVYQQRYNADGSPRAGGQKVNIHTADAQELPSVTGLSDGGWVVTWQSAGQDGSGYGIYQQRFDKDGVAASGIDELVNVGKSGDQTKPSVTAVEGGGWVVVWQNGTDLLQRIYEADGSSLFSTTVNIDSLGSTERAPNVTALKGGGWVVTWESSKDGSLRGVYKQRFSADGDAFAYPEQKVNTQTFQSQDAPSVTALDDGGWVVTWQSFAQDDGTGYLGVFQQRYRADGTPVDGEQQVNVHTNLDQGAPSVAGLEDGSWVVTWQSDGQDGSDAGIYQRLYSIVAAFGEDLEHGYGSGDNEVFQVRNGGLGAGDSLEAGGGIDILKMIESGSLDLTAPALLTGIEIVQGSSGNDVIMADATRLAQFAALQGGNGFDELRLQPGSYDMRGNVLSGFEAITFSGPGTLTFADRAAALLARSQTKDASLILQDDSFTLAERTQLYHQGIRKVTDASGVHTLAPTEASLSHSSVQENATAGQGIGILTGIDPNPGDGLRFELIDNAGGRFALSGNQLVVGNGSLLDYEAGASHRITVRIVDEGGIATDASFTITLSDVPTEILKGTSGSNVLTGGSGKDVLYGGLGKDTLTGAGGQDVFVFDTKPDKTKNVDKITDFSVPDDAIWLENKVFTKLGKKGNETKPAQMKKDFFTIGSKAKDKNDYIVYDNKKGVLYYDADGSGSKIKQIEIATLSKKLKMTYKDFFVI